MSEMTVGNSVDEPSLVQKLSAEALGTFVLVLFGCGAAVVSGDYLSTGLAFGLAIAVMIYAVGRISGGHFNPAVSVGAAVGGRISWMEAMFYIVAQVIGAILGAAVLLILLQGMVGYDFGDPIGANAFGDAGNGYAWWAAFLAELILTALFVLVILAVTDRRNEHPVMAPLAIGLALTGIHLVSMGMTGTSVNPARSIGPALFSGDIDIVLQLWLFILAPLAGATVAGLSYGAVFGLSGQPVPGSRLRFRRPQRAGAVPGYGAPDQYQQQWNQPDPSGWAQVPQGYPQQGGWQAGQAPPQPQPTRQWEAPEQQQWQQPPPPQNQPPRNQPPQAPPPQGPPQQWGAPQQPQQYGEPPAPPEQNWDDGEDGRTQIRPPDGGQS